MFVHYSTCHPPAGPGSDGRYGKWRCVWIDATINLDFDLEDQYDGERYPKTVHPHKEDMDRTSRWEEHGFPPETK